MLFVPGGMDDQENERVTFVCQMMWVLIRLRNVTIVG
jgi:hypothetical protein